jgi:proteasome lid subunit RPN8/RPN11
VKIHLHLIYGLYEDLLAHLLPRGNVLEQAAFLFAKSTQDEATLRFDVVAADNLKATDFDEQGPGYLELADETRKRLIKRAHDLGTSLIEVHSHPMPRPAQFSEYDREGLLETVPHMLWRLANRPYVAIVVAPSGFDALVWLSDPDKPTSLDALVAGTQILKPTNLSLGRWQ